MEGLDTIKAFDTRKLFPKYGTDSLRYRVSISPAGKEYFATLHDSELDPFCGNWETLGNISKTGIIFGHTTPDLIHLACELAETITALHPSTQDDLYEIIEGYIAGKKIVQ